MAKTDRKSQRARRRWMTFRDQHGRKYGAPIEKETGDPCGTIQPQFVAPFYPPQQYFILNQETPGLLVIDYERWIADLESRIEKQQAQLESYAIAHYPNPSEAVANPPKELKRAIGPGPDIHPDLVRAMQAGNRWALGFAPTMPRWAEPLMPKTLTVARQSFPDAPGEERRESEAERAWSRMREPTMADAEALLAAAEGEPDAEDDDEGEGVVLSGEGDDDDPKARELDAVEAELERPSREERSRRGGRRTQPT